MWRCGMTQSQHRNNDNNCNDNNVMCASVWFALFGVYSRNYDIWEGNMTIRSEVQTKNIRSLGFQGERGVTLRGLIQRSLQCIVDAHYLPTRTT